MMKDDPRSEGSNLNDLILEFLEMPDIHSLLAKGRERIGAGLAFRYYNTAKTVASSGSRDFLSNAKTFPLSEMLRLYESHPVVDGTSPCGCLFLDGQSRGKGDPALEALVIGLRFLFRREMSEERNRRLFIARFFEDLLLNRISSELEIRKRGELLGIPIDEEAMVFLIEGLSEENQDFVMTRMKAFFQRAYFLTMKGMLVNILFLRNVRFDVLRDNIAQIVDSVLQERPKTGDTGPACLHFGAGDARPNLLLLPESYEEARSALIFSMIHRREVAVFWREIGAFGVICSLAGSEEAASFCSSRLGAVMEHDRRHNTNLLETLSAIESCNWNLALAAERLFFHYNTLKYRYGKLQQLLKGDLRDSAFRFDVAFALRVHSVRSLLEKLG